MRLFVKEHRQKQNVSQKELAQRVGVSSTAVCHWESGQAYPTCEKLPRIARVLDCTIADLFRCPSGSIICGGREEVHGREHTKCDPESADQ